MATQTRLKAGGLDWLASRDPERWIHRSSKRSGSPYVARIAKDAGIGRSSLHEFVRGNRAPGREAQDRLRDLAVSTGVSHDRAQSELFEPIEVSTKAAA